MEATVRYIKEIHQKKKNNFQENVDTELIYFLQVLASLLSHKYQNHYQSGIGSNAM